MNPVPGPQEATPISPHALEAAAGWLMQLHSGTATTDDHQALARWQQQDPEHARAWQRAEEMLKTLGDIPPIIGKTALDRPSSPSRRRALRQLALLLTAGPALWIVQRELPWQELVADYRTATGVQREVLLADGSHLLLNTDSAVDVRFNTRERHLRLQSGEMLVSTGTSPSFRNAQLSVTTHHGQLLSSSARFTVRQKREQTHVAVLAGTLSIHPRQATGPARQLVAGEQCHFSAYEAQPGSLTDDTTTAWTQGMLIADRMTMRDVIAELGRYRSGILRCSPEIAGLLVSGSFPVTDTDRSLALLARTFPVQVRRIGNLWASVEART